MDSARHTEASVIGTSRHSREVGIIISGFGEGMWKERRALPNVGMFG